MSTSLPPPTPHMTTKQGGAPTDRKGDHALLRLLHPSLWVFLFSYLPSTVPLIDFNSSFLKALLLKIKELNVLMFFFFFSQVFISGGN